MIVDCHGHFTTAPDAHFKWWKDRQDAVARDVVAPLYPSISDDEIRETLEQSQLPLVRERGIDLTLFSPRASAMAHHIGDRDGAAAWARASNDLIARVVGLYPDLYLGVGQLPQRPDDSLEPVVSEVERAVDEHGFVGFLLNPDPSGGYWRSPPLTDAYWFPLYETLVELEVAAMIHPSASANPAFHGTGDHYLNADTTAFMQLECGDLFARFPTLQIVIPHGGGAVPYHWGRYRGLADMLERPPIESYLLPNVSFDTCVYHQAGIDLLVGTIPIDNVLFGSEMVGAVRGRDPITGHFFDDTRRYIEAAAITAEARSKIFERNVRRVFPRVDRALAKIGR